MARIGVFGGSFNPPHLGHLLAVREFQRALSLDRVLLVPAATPPHKALSANSPSARERFEMTILAASQLPFAEVSDLELRREGASYTADTLVELRGAYPNDELYLLMGTDMFLSFDRWYQPERIAALATLAVAHRSEDKAEKLQAQAAALEKAFHVRTVFVDNEFLPHSSTSVRALLAFGAAEEYLAPAVLAYIQKNHLYFCGADLKNLPFDRLQEVSLCLHNPKRVAHVQGCSETAALLAEKFGANVTDARRAGILHDITKALNSQEQLNLCANYGMILTQFQRENPKLLHAKTGAAVAERIFGENTAVCEAICWHTTGKANMTTLEKIIYLADYMEPNRNFDGVEELRRLTYADLDEAMYLGLQMTAEQLRSRGSEIDEHTLSAMGFFEERKKRS